MKIGNYILAALVLLVLTHSAHALDPSQPVNSYIQTHFTSENGLSNNVVNEIMQSRDGFLWITYGSGAVDRFDGQSFSLSLSHGGPMALAPDGDLWLWAKELVQVSAATFNQEGLLEPISHGKGVGSDNEIFCLHFDRSGILWIGTNLGLYRYEHGVFSSVVPHLTIQRIEEASNGDLLLTTSDGFMVWNGSRVVPQTEVATQLGVKVNEIFHVVEDSHGVTWISTSLGVARRIGNSIEKLQPWGPHHGIFRVYEDPQSNIWIAGAAGLFRATTAGMEPVVNGMKVRCMYGDMDGNLWVGTNGDGLFRFKDRAVRMFTTADGLPGNLPMTVLTSHDGTLWTGFNCGGLTSFDGHGFRTYNEKDGLLNSCVFALAEDANRDLWIGTYGGGAFRFRNGSFTQYSKPQGLRSDAVLKILPTRDGSLWLVTADGLSRLRNGQVRNYTTGDGLSSNSVVSIYEDRGGRLWVGTRLGMDRLEGERFVKVSSIPNEIVWPIGDDSSGRLYFGLFGKALLRLDGDVWNEITETGVNGTYMLETEQGDLWLSGGAIFRIPRAGLEKPRGHDEPLDVEAFEHADGMSAPECSSGFPNLARTRDGKLWVATVQGLAMLDLPRLPRTARKPVIFMKEITLGRNQQPAGQQLVLPAGTSHFELRFDGIDITSPEKIFMQYRLDGVDSEWLDAPLPGHAIYSTIPAGTHSFHIRACNRNGIWDRVGIVYIITQQPYFYETTWFRLAMVAIVLLLVVGLYRLRLRQATARLKVRFDERLGERTRIARELHDTLLQTVQGSKFVADDALEKSNDSVPVHVRQALERLSKWLGQATQEGRAAVNSLRTSSMDTNDLAEGLRRATEECVIDRSMKMKYFVTGGPRDMHPIARDEIYRIGYEAIRNACEHASASELDVHLNYADDLTLQVNDNGSGIEPSIVAEGKVGHFGLQGMRERAERIGSEFTLVSSPNAGTAITLVVPGKVIYRNASTTRLDKIKTFFRLGNRPSDSDEPSAY